MLLAVALGVVDLAMGQEPVATDPAVDALERQLELGRHERLMARIAEGDTTMNDFVTDGCSGGLSTGWDQIAARFPEFAARHGQEPPWQACCVVHDRHYHAGGADGTSAEESFEQRKGADLALKTCVVEAGVERSDELREIYGLTEGQVSGLYAAIAELMYRAVRLGGIPCTNRPWRWGYGWPPCR
jgi:hypothetical protein